MPTNITKKKTLLNYISCECSLKRLKHKKMFVQYINDVLNLAMCIESLECTSSDDMSVLKYSCVIYTVDVNDLRLLLDLPYSYQSIHSL